MSDINILTSQNVNVKYTVAGVGARMLAYLVDSVVYIVIMFIYAILMAVSSGNPAMVLVVLIPVFYPLLMEVFFNGQTLGKMAMDIRVVKVDGSKPGFIAYLLRWIFIIVDIMMSFGSIATITIIFSKNSQRPGDMAAGTTVIRVSPRTTLSQIAPLKFQEDYVPAFSEVNLLTEYDISLVKKVITKRSETWDQELSTKMAKYIKQKMGVTSDQADLKFLKTVLQDYEYYALQDKTIV